MSGQDLKSTEGISLTALSTALPEATPSTTRADELAKVRPQDGKQHLSTEQQQGTSDVVELIKQLLTHTRDHGIDDILRLLEEKDVLSKHDAEKSLELLFSTTPSTRSSAQVLGRLLSTQQEARKLLVPHIKHDTGNVYRRCLAAGSDGTTPYTASLLADQLWSSSQDRMDAASKTTHLCMAGLRDGQDAVLILGILVRLIGTTSSALLLDEQTIPTLIALLDIRRSQAVQSQALLLLIRSQNTEDEKLSTLAINILLQRGSSKSHDDLMVAFSAAAALFPVMPKPCAELLMTPQVLQGVLACLKPTAGMVSDDLSQPMELRHAALALLSASCIDKACRAAIKKECSAQLGVLEKDHDTKCAVLASLILVKSGSNDADSSLSNNLADIALNDDLNRPIALEALAYTSLVPKIKDALIKNTALLKRMFKILETRDEALLSCMTLLANLCAFKVSQSKEDERLAQLKAYAEAGRPKQDDRLNDDKAVLDRCRKLIDAGAVSAIIACCKGSQTVTILGLAARILHALSRQTTQRAKMVQEGIIGTLLRIREITDRTQSASAMTAAHALARVLISVNPEHAFASTVSAGSVVAALVSLLTPAIEDGRRDWLPTFEALLALTNMASMDDDSIRGLIVSRSWLTVENDLLLSGNNFVQRASVELTCNLMQSPTGVAKYAEDTEAASRRLLILLALTDVDDLSTRLAAAGALATLTGWEGITEKLLKQPKALPLLLKLAVDGNDDLRLRGLVSVMNMISAPAKSGEQSIAALKPANGKQILEGSLKTTTNDELRAMANEIITRLS